MKSEKSNKGGKRNGSGNKPKYGETTTTIAFRIPISKKLEIKEVVKLKLKTYEVIVNAAIKKSQ